VTRCYHTTDAADAILRTGFRDAEGSYGFTTVTMRVVFLADDPVGIDEGRSMRARNWQPGSVQSRERPA
jgi:hypothetical protein